jgi:hypothetical protein
MKLPALRVDVAAAASWVLAARLITCEAASSWMRRRALSWWASVACSIVESSRGCGDFGRAFGWVVAPQPSGGTHYDQRAPETKISIQ